MNPFEHEVIALEKLLHTPTPPREYKLTPAEQAYIRPLKDAVDRANAELQQAASKLQAAALLLLKQHSIPEPAMLNQDCSVLTAN